MSHSFPFLFLPLFEVFLFILSFYPFVGVFFLVLEVEELSLNEEVRIREVVNHSTHSYPDLITLENLRRFGF